MPEALTQSSTVTVCPCSADVRDPTCLRPFEAKILDLHFGTLLIPVSSQLKILFD